MSAREPRAKAPRTKKVVTFAVTQSATKQPSAAKTTRSTNGRGSPAATTAMDKTTPAEPKKDSGVQVVGIGASAGGLDALSRLMKHLPVESGLAYVLVQHLHPDHQSLLPEILQRTSRIPVVGAQDGMRIVVDHAYVITPNTTMTVTDGHLRLVPRSRGRALHLPIDAFLISLADVHGSGAVGVVMSGAGSDGALGVQAIKEAGGITMAQDSATAAYASMPEHAVDTGAVDFVLTPEGIAEQLRRIGAHLAMNESQSTTAGAAIGTDQDVALRMIMMLLQKRTGVDFQHYRRGTVHRRILRRMLVHQQTTRGGYLEHLRLNPAELDHLYQDLLIGVTSFFRDPEVFEALRSTAFPEMLVGHEPDAPIRVWAAGCASGEEAYSLAMALVEFVESASLLTPIQIFGTDLSEPSIAKARTGLYPASIAEVVSAERIRRFFVPEPGGFRVTKALRDLCVFSRQNILRDPPFSHLDLVSCRNVLIYLEPTLQQRVYPIFHYALDPNGLLLLGNAESVTASADLFTPFIKRHKIYRRRPSAGRALDIDFLATNNARVTGPARGRPAPISREISPGEDDVLGAANRILLAHVAAPGVVVDEELQILHFRGKTTGFLEHAAGAANLKVLKLARPELVTPIRTALRRAIAAEGPVREAHIAVAEVDAPPRRVAIEIIPFQPSPTSARYFHILFHEELIADIKAAAGLSVSRRDANGRASRRDESEVVELRLGLAATQRDLETLGEEHEAAVEELRAANEEIQSSNEELQSTNEELETTKEEVQSTNEELLTINEELRDRNRDLGTLSNDLSNVLASTTIPIVLVGSDLCVRRFTPATDRVMRVIATDVSRPLKDIKLRVPLPDLEAQIATVIDTLSVIEQEIQDEEGMWWGLSIRPYQTLDRRVDGVVLVFADIDVSKRYADHIAAENLAQRESLVVSEGAREAANQMRDEADFANASKGTFLARMSHDLRTPLNAITGYADLLEIGVHGPVNDAQLADLARIKLSSRHLLSLINDILNFAKLEVAQLEFRIGDIELLPLIAELEGLITLQLKAKSLHFSTDLCELCVTADPERLRQILLNLFTNAVKFTAPGGRVGISCERQDHMAHIKVWDTGIGIAPDQHARIFDPFVQLNRGLSNRTVDGVGLGLAISRNLARAMGGNLMVESGPSQGSRFLLTLPLALGSGTH